MVAFWDAHVHLREGIDLLQDDVFASVMVLLAGINPNIIVQKSGRVREKERTWEFAKKALLGNVNVLHSFSIYPHPPLMREVLL